MFALTDKPVLIVEALTHVGGFRLSGNRVSIRAGLSPAHSRKGFSRLVGISRAPDDTKSLDCGCAELKQLRYIDKPTRSASHEGLT